MKEEKNPVYATVTLEFVTVALEYCHFVEHAAEVPVFDFIDKATKLLPLLYLKGALLPVVEEREEEDTEVELMVTEACYESIRNRLATLLGGGDSYLDTFHTDMQYSDTPIAASISENLADVYQDIANFIYLFRQGNEEVMRAALILCRKNFGEYWGQQLLNALKALHTLRYSDAANLQAKDYEA